MQKGLMKRIGLIILIWHVANSSLLSKDDTKYAKADSVAALYKGHDLIRRFELVQMLTSPFEDEELKFRAIYSWVCLNIENDYRAYLKNDMKRRKYMHKPAKLDDWNKTFRPKVLTKLMGSNKTVCTGYAYLIKELAAYIDIEVMVVDGYGRSATVSLPKEEMPNHSWNAVKLNGAWHLVDATWDSGYTLMPIGLFVPSYDGAYFLKEPSVFQLNHLPLEPKWQLQEEVIDMSQFVNFPLVYRGAFMHDIYPLKRQVFSQSVKRFDEVTFGFYSAHSSIDISELSLRKDVHNKEAIGLAIEPMVLEDTFQYVMPMNRKGIHVYHLYYGADVLMTFRVVVKKQ